MNRGRFHKNLFYQRYDNRHERNTSMMNNIIVLIVAVHRVIIAVIART